MRRLSPLLTNLAIGAIARLLIPITLADGGERYLHYTMTLFFPFDQCPSFHCFRFAPALMASLLPLQVIDAFLVVGFVCECLAGTLIWHIAEHVGASPRAALLASAWFWAVWGPLPALRDPLLIPDPVMTLWIVAALVLLLQRRYLVALPVLVSGAGVKESVLLVPFIYAAYLVLSRQLRRTDLGWIVVTIAIPTVAWIAVRRYLIAAFGYAPPGDSSYLAHPYLFGTWLAGFGEWPRNVMKAALYVFAGFSSAWIFGALGLVRANRRPRALAVASIAAMIFLALYQEPQRAVTNFSFAAVVPAALYLEPLPAPLVAAVLAVNAALTIRMSATVGWLPPISILLPLLLALTAICVFLRERRSKIATMSAAAMTTALTGGRVTATAVAIVALALILVAGRRFAAAGALSIAPFVPSDATILVDDDRGTPGFALTRDERQVVFVGSDASQVRRLWIRSAPPAAAQPLAGTESASAPFSSPDARSIGFFADGQLKTIDLASRAVRVLAEAPDSRGGAWGRNEIIVFASGHEGRLQQIAASAGSAATAPVGGDPQDGASFRWPSFLPDGEHFLFVERSASGDDGLRLGSIGSRESQRVLNDASSPVFAPPGLVFFSRWNHLVALPFDTRRHAFMPYLLIVSDTLATAPGLDRAALAGAGRMLMFATATSTSQSLVASGPGRVRVFDRHGAALKDVADLAGPGGIELLPDGTRVAFTGNDDHGVSVHELDSGAGQPILPRAIVRSTPIWSPDGRRFAFAERIAGTKIWQMRINASDSGGRTSIDATWPIDGTPIAWSPDGRTLLYVREDPDGSHLWASKVGNDPNPEPFAPPHMASTAARVGAPPIATAAQLILPLGLPGQSVRPAGFGAGQAQFSPDGRWIAYAADDRGFRDVYVEPYPATGERWLVSPDGGSQPRWRGDGRELIYVSENRFFMAVDVETAPSFHAGRPRMLFEARVRSAQTYSFQYAISRDAQRFVVDTIPGVMRSAPAKVVLNWRGAPIE